MRIASALKARLFIQEKLHALMEKGEVSKVGRFLAAGLPAFVLAIPLNFALVELAGWPKPLAYAVVLIVQVAMNFFACRWFVFKPGSHKTAARQFAEFSAGILGFRLADWLLYSALVQVFPRIYLAIQAGNVLLFAVLKYRFSKRVMEG